MDTRLLHPWDFLGKITGVGCHFLLQGTSQPRDWTQVSHIVDRCFTVWATVYRFILLLIISLSFLTVKMKWYSSFQRLVPLYILLSSSPLSLLNVLPTWPFSVSYHQSFSSWVIVPITPTCHLVSDAHISSTLSLLHLLPHVHTHFHSSTSWDWSAKDTSSFSLNPGQFSSVQ